MKYSVTYEIITEESAEHGDAEERGFISEGVSLRDAIDDLMSASADRLTCIEANDSYDPYWVTVCYAMHFVTGDYERRSLHLPRNLSLSTRKRIARLLGAK